MSTQNRISTRKRAITKARSTGKGTSKNHFKVKLIEWLLTNNKKFICKGGDLPPEARTALALKGISPKLWTMIIFSNAMITIDELYCIAKVIGADPKDLV